jgi:hypothetical protein
MDLGQDESSEERTNGPHNIYPWETSWLLEFEIRCLAMRLNTLAFSNSSMELYVNETRRRVLNKDQAYPLWW